MKCVWLDLKTGEFSESWDYIPDDPFFKNLNLDLYTKNGWKLIKYSCENDSDFNFCDLMKIVTSDKCKKRQKRRAK